MFLLFFHNLKRSEGINNYTLSIINDKYNIQYLEEILYLIFTAKTGILIADALIADALIADVLIADVLIANVLIADILIADVLIKSNSQETGGIYEV